MYSFQLFRAAQSLVDALAVAKNFRLSDCIWQPSSDASAVRFSLGVDS